MAISLSTIAASLSTLCFLLFFPWHKTAFHLYRIVVQRKRTDTILLVGFSGSGKTTLFYQKEKAKPARRVDIPGHLRLRAKVDEFLREAGGIIFLVDAVDFISNVRTTAEYLYEVLTKAWVVKNKIPVLIVGNKMDKVTAHAPDFIRKQLDKEIKKLHPTQNALCDADAASEATLGKGEPFKLAHCANRVTVEEASVITNQIMNIEEFIRTRIR